MKPGKELNELVASKVMGMVQHPDFNHLWSEKKHVGSPFIELPNFSEDFTEASKVVEKIHNMENRMFRLEDFDSQWKAGPVSENDILPNGEAKTVSHAICLAALRAVGVEIKKPSPPMNSFNHPGE